MIEYTSILISDNLDRRLMCLSEDDGVVCIV